MSDISKEENTGDEKPKIKKKYKKNRELDNSRLNREHNPNLKYIDWIQGHKLGEL